MKIHPMLASLLAALFLLPGAALSQDFDPSYSAWDGLLKRYVDKAGMVDYPGLAKDPALGGFLDGVAALSFGDVGGWSHDQQVAFYINVYNAITLQTILDGGIPASINDLDKPWDVSRWRVAGREMSLNFIEHSKLRKHLGEPRVHFVLVCAAKGCPRLRRGAFVPEKLEAQLEAASKEFLSADSKNQVDRGSGKVRMSKIFEWYGDDFIGKPVAPGTPPLLNRGPRERAILQLLWRYASPEDRGLIEAGDFAVSYLDYDWALNRQ